jgi:hypothetical protein
MKYLKLFESFEIGMGVHNIVNDFGLVMEDIEDLFIDFSDMGYDVRIITRTLDIGDVLIVDIKGLGNRRRGNEINLLNQKIIRASEKLGLNMVEPPKWITQFANHSDLRFKFNKL